MIKRDENFFLPKIPFIRFETDWQPKKFNKNFTIRKPHLSIGGGGQPVWSKTTLLHFYFGPFPQLVYYILKRTIFLQGSYIRSYMLLDNKCLSYPLNKYARIPEFIIVQHLQKIIVTFVFIILFFERLSSRIMRI